MPSKTFDVQNGPTKTVTVATNQLLLYTAMKEAKPLFVEGFGEAPARVKLTTMKARAMRFVSSANAESWLERAGLSMNRWSSVKHEDQCANEL